MFHKRPNVTLRPRRTGYLHTHGRYSFATALYTQCVRANNQFDTQNTPNSARSHYNINSGIHINLITMNNTSLSHNSTYVRLLQERTLNDPTSRVTTRGRHQSRRQSPMATTRQPSDTDTAYELFRAQFGIPVPNQYPMSTLPPPPPQHKRAT